MFKDRTKNYCKTKKEGIMKTIYKEILENRSDKNCDVWAKSGHNQENPCYADKDGLIQCGIVHDKGKRKMKQKCKYHSTHQINPFCSYIERAFLWLFELDHE